MILPLMIAKWPPAPSVIELTEKALGGMSGPAWSVSVCLIFAAGFQPIGQNGLRLPLSILKLDLFFTSRAGGASAAALRRRVVAMRIRNRIVNLIVLESRSRRLAQPVDIRAGRRWLEC